MWSKCGQNAHTAVYIVSWNWNWSRIAPGHYSMSGLAEKYEVEDFLGIKMPEGDYNSIGGFMCTTIDRIPFVGEACTVETAAERIRFEISKVDDRRVLQVEAFRKRKDGKDPTNEDEDDEERDKAWACWTVNL